MKYASGKVGDMFMACCILHNIVQHAGLLQDIDVELMEDDEDIFVAEMSSNPHENACWQQINQYFTW